MKKGKRCSIKKEPSKSISLRLDLDVCYLKKFFLNVDPRRDMIRNIKSIVYHELNHF